MARKWAHLTLDASSYTKSCHALFGEDSPYFLEQLQPSLGPLHEDQNNLHGVHGLVVDVVGEQLWTAIGLGSAPAKRMINAPTDLHKSRTVIQAIFKGSIEELAHAVSWQHMADKCSECRSMLLSISSAAQVARQQRCEAAIAEIPQPVPGSSSSAVASLPQDAARLDCPMATCSKTYKNATTLTTHLVKEHKHGFDEAQTIAVAAAASAATAAAATTAAATTTAAVAAAAAAATTIVAAATTAATTTIADVSAASPDSTQPTATVAIPIAFQPGQRVELHSLSESCLNGTIGTVVRCDTENGRYNGRYVVHLAARKDVSIKAVCLRGEHVAPASIARTAAKWKRLKADLQKRKLEEVPFPSGLLGVLFEFTLSSTSLEGFHTDPDALIILLERECCITGSSILDAVAEKGLEGQADMAFFNNADLVLTEMHACTAYRRAVQQGDYTKGMAARLKLLPAKTARGGTEYTRCIAIEEYLKLFETETAAAVREATFSNQGKGTDEIGEQKVGCLMGGSLGSDSDSYWQMNVARTNRSTEDTSEVLSMAGVAPACHRSRRPLDDAQTVAALRAVLRNGSVLMKVPGRRTLTNLSGNTILHTMEELRAVGAAYLRLKEDVLYARGASSFFEPQSNFPNVKITKQDRARHICMKKKKAKGVVDGDQEDLDKDVGMDVVVDAGCNGEDVVEKNALDIDGGIDVDDEEDDEEEDEEQDMEDQEGDSGAGMGPGMLDTENCAEEITSSEKPAPSAKKKRKRSSPDTAAPVHTSVRGHLSRAMARPMKLKD